MRFNLFAFAAAIVATQSHAVAVETEVDESEQLSNEMLFPQVAAFMNNLSDNDLDQIENYMSQVFSSEDSEDGTQELLAQLDAEEDNDLAVVANYLAQLNGEELNELADHSSQLNEQAFAQAMNDRDLGDMWENMQGMAPNFAQAFARELLEQDEDFL